MHCHFDVSIDRQGSFTTYKITRTSSWLLHAVGALALSLMMGAVASWSPWAAVSFFCIVISLPYLIEVEEESLTFMEEMGITMRARTRCGFTIFLQFAPMETISHSFIKEELTTNDVKLLLTFERRQAAPLVAFSRTLPPLSILKQVQQDLRIPSRS